MTTAGGDPLRACDLSGIVTRDESMLAILRLLVRVAPTRAPVLILGPTGTGKELLAELLHKNSQSRTGPFVPVHCSAIPASMFEAELFGHVAGAFSGAHRDRPGRIAAARGGTLFLDEVGELPLDFQTKLLRFLQLGEIQRIGADRPEAVDTRVVAATHQDLTDLIRQRRFREDLYYRLNLIRIDVPSLRQRPSDVPLLMEHFLERFAAPGRKLRLSPRAREWLTTYDYPGNVRELSHIIERACILATGTVVDIDLFPPELVASTARAGAARPLPEALTADALERARAAAVAEAERQFLRELMASAEGNVSRAARQAGMHRSYLQKLLLRHRATVPRDTAPPRASYPVPAHPAVTGTNRRL